MADNLKLTATFDVSGAIKRLKYLADTDIDRRLRAGMNETVAAVQAEVQGHTPVNLGLLRAGIGTKVTGQGLNVQGLVSPSPATMLYAPVMEFGRKPGASMPPVTVIEHWVERKGIAHGKDAKSVAFRIARSISRKGIKGRGMFKRGRDLAAKILRPILLKHLSR